MIVQKDSVSLRCPHCQFEVLSPSRFMADETEYKQLCPHVALFTDDSGRVEFPAGVADGHIQTISTHAGLQTTLDDFKTNGERSRVLAALEASRYSVHAYPGGTAYPGAVWIAFLPL